MSFTGKDLIALGWKGGPLLGEALDAARQAESDGIAREVLRSDLAMLWAAPAALAGHERWGALARALIAQREQPSTPTLREHAIPFRVWGREALDAATLDQMRIACRLPVAVAAAQMPDGHVGYGLPIGGVLATRGAVIPYGVGVDIACRMRLTVVDLPAAGLEEARETLRKALIAETRFGAGACFQHRQRREHAMMDDPLWDRVHPVVQGLKDKAWSQLGTSGSGNHFVEWGELDLPQADLGLPAGRYVALLSHSGSRGFGAQIAQFYTKAAMEQTPLEPAAKRLAWLDLATEAGEGYWNAMTLAGLYAAANHELIHRHVVAAAGLEPLAVVENHHNFAWMEEHGGEEVVVHRKGATPAGVGALGVIPGSMADPGFVVRGKGEPASLNSAAHGAGRAMSRTAARKSLAMADLKRLLRERRVELISAGIDEAPMAYKPIREVMAAQRDLVEIVAEFQPRIVRMADDGTAED
ncbi:MAG: RtcB family protein [Candidatus Sumerlaeia bacterium]|nr:RtcB family protein [Candidatus Sumerlaeia bacterium]